MSAVKRWSKANQRQNTRHKPRYDRYRNELRRGMNKGARLLKHLERAPGDQVARAAFERLSQLEQRKARAERKRRDQSGMPLEKAA